MEDYALDPYEQQLLKVFNSHDRDNCGSLDSAGLTQLCQTLQLEEHGTSLVKCLLQDKRHRVNFADFKDALLALLGNMQQTTKTATDEKSSPEREVSPKFVYGSKKYGRRSRPRLEPPANEHDPPDKPPQTCNVQRSNSNAEVSSKKRKTNYRLQRCASLPAGDEPADDPELVCTEEMLREAWKKLAVGQDGHLNQTELILVCDAIGLRRLAEGVIRQLSDKLALNRDHKISFQELLNILRQDDTWYEVLNRPSIDETGSVPSSGDGLFPDSRTFHLVTLGPDGNGTITADSLIEMWESVGIHSPKELLHELGFDCRRINILDLADVLDKQIKGINEVTRSKYQSPQVALLQASLALYQSEIKTFKNLLEQMHVEREKLKCHVTEANNRATLLAQEVDDNHSRMEQNTVNQVKLLEQRHADIVKELTAQFAKDKDQSVQANRSLEEKISTLEVEVGKLKNDLSVAGKYSLNLEKDNRSLSMKIDELERDKDRLSGRIETLEGETQKSCEMERRENDLLLGKLASLRTENDQLKDKNDEMASEIESLSNQVASMRTKVSSTPAKINSLDQSMDENISIICEGVGVGVGAKRRNQYSPSKENHLFGIDKSPRLGKIRKYGTRSEAVEGPFTSSESGFDGEGDYLDSSSSVSTNDNDELVRLQSKVAFLEQILKQNGVPLPQSYEKSNTNAHYLTGRISDLERLIRNVKEAMRALIDSDDLDRDRLRKFGEKLDRTLLGDCPPDSITVESQTDPFEHFEAKANELETENRSLAGKCADLESCVELLKNEYEKCEDYWQNLVDEERQMYEAEQKVNSDKLAELILKMQDYEEQYAEKDARLPAIEERYNLEKQFTDLEEEFESYRERSETILSQKDDEIRLLKEKLTELALRQRNDVAVQAQTDSESERVYKKMQNLSCYLIENTDRYPEDMQTRQQQQQNVWNPDWQESAKSLPVNFELYNSTGAPSTSCSTASLDQPSSPGTPCRPKRTKKYNKTIYKKTEQGHTEAKSAEAVEQKILIPLKSFHSLSARRNFLEQRVRHLQFCLQQQKMCNEQTLQRFWHQFNGERVDLHAKLRYLQEKLDQQVSISREQLDKLEKTDMLVKDLYVENSYLIASVQRLEQRCHILSQCNNPSSV
ncbi:unnamed protein product [Phyllotreta striolata]|uniref:EF-hand domain-containing protein n=1 Tax=Phyllotreta striolata TaxID=444603 RepID=A0A9N9U0I7_PHYSR|nr:unnamed protein product [Phyllotreta striolata]